MFKWVEISLQKNESRYNLLSDFMKENGLENSVEFIEPSIEDLPQVLESAMQKYDGIRIGRGLGEVVLSLLPNHSMMVDKVKAADAIVKSQGKWFLRTNAVDGLTNVIKLFGEKFDFDSSVLVVGSGAAARVAVTSFFMCGFKHFSISSLDKSKVELFIESLRRTHIAATFKVVLKEELVLLPGTHGIMVNTTPMSAENPMLEELYYFNFFKAGGIAVDFTILPVDTQLLKGARDVGAACIHGYQVAAATDIIWCEQIMGRNFMSESYTDRLGKHLRAQNLSV
ncbi:MAG: hypothetical protein KDD38_01220 [Bdellovibrionales bacterium]|nr:hypothetical protein [Bdellovibrionales bacterium]